MSRHPEPIRIAELADESDELTSFSSGIRTLRRAHGDDAQVRALAARLGPELAANTVAGTAVLSNALLRFMWIGAGVVGVSLGSWLLWADDAAPPVAARSVEVAPPPAPVEAPAQLATAARSETLEDPSNAASLEPESAAAPRKAVARPRPVRALADKRSAINPEAELELLSRAQALLDRDPDGALDVLGQHAREHARGVFSEEREVLALEAESKLGHKALARARAERFIEQFPRSAHARRVRTLLEPAP